MLSDSKKLVLNTRLHADAIVMQLSKGSIPDVPSLAVISMNIFRNRKHASRSISTSDLQ
jgi:hypothetical protein